MAVQLAPLDAIRRDSTISRHLDRHVLRLGVDVVVRAAAIVGGVAMVTTFGAEIAGVAVAGALALGATLFAWTGPKP